MPRTTKKAAHDELEHCAQRLLDCFSDLSQLFAATDDGPQVEAALLAAVDAEYAQYSPSKHPEDQQVFRTLAAAQVGYRFGLMMAGRRMAGGVR